MVFVNYRFSYSLLLVSILIIISYQVSAKDKFTGFAVNPKVGLWFENYFDSQFLDGTGASLGLQFSYIQMKRQYALRFATAFEPIIVPGGSPGAGEVYQLSFLYGWHRTGGIGRMKILIGPGYYWGTRLIPEEASYTYQTFRNGQVVTETEKYWIYNESPFQVPGVSIQLGMDLHLTHWMSWGLSMDAYIHARGLGLTPMFSIEFGKIREPYDN